MGSLYFRSSDFDSLPKSNCNLSNQTAISAIRLQSQQSDCNPPTLQSDCGDCSLIVEIAVKFWRLHTKHWDCNHNWCSHTAMQEDCSLIVEIAVWLLRLQKFRNLLIHAPTLHKVSGCNLHNRTAIYTIRLQCRRIAVWMLRLQSDCLDCSLIAEIAKVPQLTYTCPNPPQGVRHVARCFTLIAEIAVWLLRLQSDCWDCSPIAEIAKVPQLTYGAPTLHKVSGMLRGVLL